MKLQHIALFIILSLLITVGATSVAAQSDETGTVTAYALNVRAGPGVDFDRVDLLRRGDTVTILEEQNGWYRIGENRWVSGTYIGTGAAAPAQSASGTSGTAARSQTGGGKLLINTQLGGPIYKVNADGTGLTRVGAGIDPVWSPDGSQFAYIDWNAPQGIYVANADGSDARLIYSADRLRHLDWSPDGTKIAFARQKGGRLEAEERCFSFFGQGFCFEFPADAFWRIGYYDLETDTLREQAADLHSLSPAWTPDGQSLTFRGDDPFVPRIALRRMVIDTNERQTLIRDSSVRNVDQCSNGRLVLDYQQHDHYEIYTANADGSGLAQLTRHSPLSFDEPAVNASPAWSPDCSEIAFLSNRDGPWRIYVMNADGTNQRPMFGAALDDLSIRYSHYDDHLLDWVQ